jgi:SAM-dependent methyltransferase
MSDQQALLKLKELLSGSKGRHTNYQIVPPFIQEHFSALEYQKRNDAGDQEISLDAIRYDWLSGVVDVKKPKVLEIGSNMGYFILRLAKEYGASVKAFEPITEYAEASELMAKVSELENFEVNKEIADHERIEEEGPFDLAIQLNVLHHAGVDYDRDKIQDPQSWRRYAIDNLKNLASVSRRLFFQCGNYSTGGQQWFPMEEAITFLNNLLEEAGWEVLQIGSFQNFEKMIFKSYSPAQKKDIPALTCSRNPETQLVDYSVDGVVKACLPTGLPARSLWYCKSRIRS